MFNDVDDDDDSMYTVSICSVNVYTMSIKIVFTDCVSLSFCPADVNTMCRYWMDHSISTSCVCLFKYTVFNSSLCSYQRKNILFSSNHWYDISIVFFQPQWTKNHKGVVSFICWCILGTPVFLGTLLCWQLAPNIRALQRNVSILIGNIVDPFCSGPDQLHTSFVGILCELQKHISLLLHLKPLWYMIYLHHIHRSCSGDMPWYSDMFSISLCLWHSTSSYIEPHHFIYIVKNP